jgi:hypothetical protein
LPLLAAIDSFRYAIFAIVIHYWYADDIDIDRHWLAITFITTPLYAD